MKIAALALLLSAALLATGGLALLGTRERTPEVWTEDPQASEPETAAPDAVKTARESAEPGLRPYRTTATLTEDLRDVVALPNADVDTVWRTVSAALKPRAVWTLERIVPQEATPRVRALLLLAAGVHAPDTPEVIAALRDREPVVRGAAALTIGFHPRGATRVPVTGNLALRIGRKPAKAAETALRAQLAAETDAGVKTTIELVLRAADSPSER
ncbi:MAG: hypothetical protein V3T86_16005 [Planctomycetota bacterium]